MIEKDLTKEFILSEVKKLQYLYGLKREIRYGQIRQENDLTESVAEHIYGMHILAHYFLPLENPVGDWDSSKIFSLITWHDIDEIETGDMVGYLKDSATYAAEEAAALRVLDKSPSGLTGAISQIITEYANQTTPEAKFVKAIDRFEPLIQIYSEFGHNVLNNLTTKAEDSSRIKEAYLKPFPTMYQYYRVIHQAMIDENFFIK